ncbi:hypothetical protein EDB19DRAFT_1831949 [Suillus lakei]|nr:hypothetical protein EDB19DRAFT_1831949 [Suillus lakei]
MSNSNVVPIAHSAMREDLSVTDPDFRLSQGQWYTFLLKFISYWRRNALLPSSVEVQINSGATGVHYRGRINPRDAITTSQLHENVYPHQGPSGTRWEHATTILGTGSSGFESAPRDLKSHAALQVHYPSLPPELPSTIQPIFLPSASSSSNTTPLSNQPHLLGGGATAPEIPPADSRISHHMEHATQSAQGHQTQHSGSYGFELALGGLKHHAVLQNHHSSSPPELPSTMQPIIISSVSSSTTATPPASAQPPFLGGSTTLPKILSADGQVFHHSEDGIQPAHWASNPAAWLPSGLHSR